ncbi:WD40 repeat-like protein [Pluteus cervinus]|uniref:WD40 repeat-like protein n=1 Tax=Pluteus cervinus TaxID=181527 RepID=A0ACD3BEZ5_9AGAR|nr:WD40 repeat-like protein [Pluteus cervinus]
MSQTESDDNLDEYDGEEDQENEFNLDDDNANFLDDIMEEGDGSDSGDDNSDDDSDDDDDDEQPPSSVVAGPTGSTPMDVDALPPPPAIPTPERKSQGNTPPLVSDSPPPAAPPESSRNRSPSPATIRKHGIIAPVGFAGPQPRSYTIEAICALPHPVPTHSLASSVCMTHFLTGSDDGYIRNYDIFSAVNGKSFLTAPQRHHSGVVEGIMKAGQIKFWWENPSLVDLAKIGAAEEEASLAPVYSLALQSDALWALAGTDTGHINLFTVRHDPGRLCHALNGHKGPVSALSLDHDEKSFFSCGWDGEAIQWDLNTGQNVRNFTAHGAQMTALAVRPLSSGFAEVGPSIGTRSGGDEGTSPTLTQGSMMDTTLSSGHGRSTRAQTSGNTREAPPLTANDSDTKSDASFDPLFDDEDPEDDTGHPLGQDMKLNEGAGLAIPGMQPPPPPPPQPAQPRITLGTGIAPPKNAPPLLDPIGYPTYSRDLLMTASIDGQVILWDRRVHSPGKGVGRLWMSEKTPPWCLSACWSADGGQIYAGRRNGTVDVWDVRQLGKSGPTGTPRLVKTLRNPASSGVVSCVAALPDCRHIACASIDNLRLWNVAEAAEFDSSVKARSGVQFKIIPGHHGGYISQLLIDPGARFLISASSNRGWHGDSTKTVFVHDIKAAY